MVLWLFVCYVINSTITIIGIGSRPNHVHDVDLGMLHSARRPSAHMTSNAGYVVLELELGNPLVTSFLNGLNR